MKLRRLIKRAEKHVRQGQVQALACLRELAWVRSRLHLPRNESFELRSSQEQGVSVRLVDPEEAFERPLPAMPGEREMHETFLKEQSGVAPASYVAELRRGRFWGHYGGAVFTDDGRLVPELSKDVWGPLLHSAYVRTRLPRPRLLAGRTLSLVTPEATTNYHHWTVDMLPRTGLVVRAGYRLADFDHVLIKDRGLPYQRESFARLGLRPEQLIQVSDHDHFEAETLVIPAIRLDNTRVPRRDIEYVRRLYLADEPVPSLSHKRLYVGRKDASFRRVLNEDAFMPFLKENGFEEVAMSGLSVADQARLFSEASIIVAPNGSALANLVFANRACRVVEFFAPGWVVGYNWMICAALGISFTALIGGGPRPPRGTLPREIKQDIEIDADLLKRTVAALL